MENNIRALVIIPSDYPKDRDIAKSISELVRKYGGFCCHTSSPTMKFDSIEKKTPGAHPCRTQEWHQGICLQR